MHSPFELLTASTALTVVRLKARERLNQPTRVDLTLDTNEVADLRLGTKASVAIHGSPLGARFFHGIVTRVGRGQTRTDVRVEARLARLRGRKTHRIFHDCSHLEVVKRLLEEHRIPLRLRITRSYPKAPHLIQRGESDLAFVERLLAEAGIFYFFDHTQQTGRDLDTTNLGEGEIVVLADSASAYSVLTGSPLHQRAAQTGAVRDDQALVGLVDERATRVERVLSLGRTFSTPSKRIFSDSILDPSVLAEPPPFPRDSQRSIAIEHLFDADDAPVLPSTARDRLDSERARSRTFRARSTNPHLMPGRRYALAEALLDDTPSELVLLEVRHDGDAERKDEFYRNDSLSTDSAVVHRRRMPQRRSAPLETATVVGPNGAELHTDGHGRVQVQFHWDLEREAPSAWVRVAQSWSGAGFGANFLPRVGTEVLVGYVGGDPDRPIILGALHNALSPPAFGHGAEADRSGIRTRSTPGGVGYHELVFDDRAGRERVGLRSQRDLSVQALGDTLIELNGMHTETIGGSSSTTVAGSASSLVGNARVDHTGADRSARVGAHDRLVVGGDSSTSVAGCSTLEVLGVSATTRIAGSRHTFVGVGPAGGSEVVASVSDIQLSAGRSIDLTAIDSVNLRCGRSTIRMTPDGIFLEADRIETHATESAHMFHGDERRQVWASDGAFTVSTDVIKLASKGASLVLDAEAKLDGALVKLNCGASAAGGAGQGMVNDSGEAVFQLDPSSVPVGSGPYTFRILDPNGEVLSRDLMPGGQVRLQGKPGQRFVLEQVRLGQRLIPFRKSQS